MRGLVHFVREGDWEEEALGHNESERYLEFKKLGMKGELEG